MLLKAPRTPTRAEVQEHEELGHVQYRDWRRLCVMSRGIGDQHRGRIDQQSVEDPDPFIGTD